MSLKLLDLDPICVSSAADNLNLSLTPTIVIRMPADFAACSGHDIVKALASGKVWASRGRRCRLDLQLSSNGSLLDRDVRLSILKSLGHHLHGAQLSISPSLEVPQQHDAARQTADLSLYLNRSAESVVDTHPRGWMLDNLDVTPPESVLCVEFEKLQIKINFHTFRKPSKRSKRCSESHKTMALMLLDSHPLLEEDTYLGQLEAVVEQLSSDLSAAVRDCFGCPERIARQPVPEPRVKHNLPLWVPIEATDPFLRWSAEHTDHPYPTSEEEKRLARNSSLDRSSRFPRPSQCLNPSQTIVQIENWFSRARRQQQRTPASSFSTGSDDTSQNVSYNLEDPENEMLLLSPTAHGYLDEDETIALSSSDFSWMAAKNHAFDPTTVLSTSVTPRKRSCEASTMDGLTLHPGVVTALTTHALHILLSGSLPRQELSNYNLQSPKTPAPRITTNNKTIENTLASLVPAFWSPGYKQIIAHHTRFLPIIERAVGGSWVRNAVGVGLRGVLGELASGGVLTVAKIGDEDDVDRARAGIQRSKADEGDEDADGESKARKAGTMDVLNAVVQSHLWGMMQRTLYDSKSAKHLRWDPISSMSQEEEGGVDLEVDLFASFNMGELQKLHGVGNVEEEGEEEGLLADFNEPDWEAEQRNAEMETDEMLLGNGETWWDGEEDEGSLFGFVVGDEEEEEGMLI